MSDNNGQFICGDALAELGKLPAGSIDMCLTSPPYWNLRDYGIGPDQLGLEPNIELYIEHMTEIFNEIKRALKKEGTLWLNIADSYSGKCLCMIPERLAQALIFGIYKGKAIQKELDASWFAGIIDGEGCIGIYKSHDYYCLRISLSSQDKELIEKIIEMTNFGTIINQVVDGKIYYHWKCQGSTASKIICDVFPFLTIKRKQALIGWNFHLVQQDFELEFEPGKKYGNEHGRPKLSKRLHDRRKELAESISALNQREDINLKRLNLSIPPKSKIGGGWILRNCIIWHKPNAMPSSVKDRFSNRWEYLFMFSKNQRYYFDLDGVREPHKYDGRHDTMYKGGPKDVQIGKHERWPNPEGKNPGDIIEDRKWNDVPGQVTQAIAQDHGGWFRKDGTPIVDFEKGKNPGDFWDINTQPFPEAHFAVFPENLCMKPIKAGCPEFICRACGKARTRITKTDYIKNRPSAGNDKRSRNEDRLSEARGHGGWRGNNLLADVKTIGWTECKCKAGFEPGVVLDPFAGAGTVGVVAKSLGRRFILIDTKEDYIKMAKKRVIQVGHQKELFK